MNIFIIIMISFQQQKNNSWNVFFFIGKRKCSPLESKRCATTYGSKCRISERGLECVCMVNNTITRDCTSVTCRTDASKRCPGQVCVDGPKFRCIYASRYIERLVESEQLLRVYSFIAFDCFFFRFTFTRLWIGGRRVVLPNEWSNIFSPRTGKTTVHMACEHLIRTICLSKSKVRFCHNRGERGSTCNPGTFDCGLLLWNYRFVLFFFLFFFRR